MKSTLSNDGKAGCSGERCGAASIRAPWILRLIRPRCTSVSGTEAKYRKLLPAAAAMLFAAGIYAAAAERLAFRPDEAIAFQIPAQPLAAALQEFGQATGIQVLYESNSAVGMVSVAVEGKFTADAALRRMLKGSDLRVRYIRPDAITLAPPSAEVLNRPSPAAPLAASDLSLGTLRVRGSTDGESAAQLYDYNQKVQMEIQNALRKNARARDGNYRMVLDLWINSARTVERAELFRSSGDRERDVAVVTTLRGVTISRAAPANTPQPVRVSIVVNSLQ